MSDWRDRAPTGDAPIRDLRAATRAATRRSAVPGIETEARGDQPAFSAPEDLHDRGVEVVPVPGYARAGVLVVQDRGLVVEWRRRSPAR